MRFTLIPLLVALFFALPARAGNPPVIEYPDLNYVNVLHALMKLDRFKPDTPDLLDAYAMVAHCDVVKGSFRDEFRWNEARKAIEKWVELKKSKLPTRLSVKSQIMFTRYDFESKYFLFSPETKIDQVNTFNTESRPADGPCAKRVTNLLPSGYRVITNNPVTMPGLRLTETEAQDLAQKMTQQNNSQRVVWIRFNIDIVEADFLGNTVFSNQPRGDVPWVVKATLHSIEFFSDPHYQHRFYYYTPL